MDWKLRAKQLAVGQRIKVPHCGNSASAYLSRSVRGSHFYCFRCNERGFEASPGVSMADFANLKNISEEGLLYLSEFDTLPMHDPKVPPEARLWFLRAGLNPKEMTERHGARYILKYKRAALPVQPNGFIARRNEGDPGPKYYMPKGSRRYFWAYPRTEIYRKAVVIVEDALSAIKVSKAGFAAMSTLGTDFPVEVLGQLFDRNRTSPYVWMDPDDAGESAAKRAMKRLSAMGLAPVKISSRRDPKKYCVQSVRDALITGDADG